MTSQTTNLGLKLIDFNVTPWHDDTNNNWQLLDTVVKAATGVSGLSGNWANSLSVTVGEKYVDPDDYTIWEVVTTHTTPSTGTFADDRTAHPSRWTGLGSGLRARGEWATGVVYAAGDLAYDSSETLYCVCAVTHTSTTSMRDDIANWTILLDGSAVAPTSSVSYGVVQTLTEAQKKVAKDNISDRNAPLQTVYVAGGTHTFNASTRFFQIEAVGGGGGGGGVDGVDPTKSGAASGGGSGFYGKTRVLAIGAVTTGTVVIGAGGAGGSGAADGVNGGDTTWVDGTNSYVWEGGKGGVGVTANANAKISAPKAAAGSTGTIDGRAEAGFVGQGGAPSAGVGGGRGGGTSFGAGGVNTATLGTSANGVNGSVRGGGGAGAQATGSALTYDGGNGAGGKLIVYEWF